jgi:hypothetical protein
MAFISDSGTNIYHYQDPFTSEKKIVVHGIPRIIIIDEDFSKEGRKEGRTPPFIVVHGIPLSLSDGGSEN